MPAAILPTNPAPTLSRQFRSSLFRSVALALAVFLSVMLFRQPNLPDCPAEIRPNIEMLAALEASHKTGQITAQDYQAQKKKLTTDIRRQADQFLSKNK